MAAPREKRRNAVDPQPGQTPGLEPGGGVYPGDTPPMADQGMQSVRHQSDVPNADPVKPNRTPMIVALVFIALMTLTLLAYGVAQIIAYVT